MAQRQKKDDADNRDLRKRAQFDFIFHFLFLNFKYRVQRTETYARERHDRDGKNHSYPDPDPIQPKDGRQHQRHTDYRLYPPLDRTFVFHIILKNY